MPKPVDIQARIAAGKSVMPLTWRERLHMTGAGFFALFIGIPALVFAAYCVVTLLF